VVGLFFQKHRCFFIDYCREEMEKTHWQINKHDVSQNKFFFIQLMLFTTKDEQYSLGVFRLASSWLMVFLG